MFNAAHGGGDDWSARLLSLVLVPTPAVLIMRAQDMRMQSNSKFCVEGAVRVCSFERAAWCALRVVRGARTRCAHPPLRATEAEAPSARRAAANIRPTASIARPECLSVAAVLTAPATSMHTTWMRRQSRGVGSSARKFAEAPAAVLLRARRRSFRARLWTIGTADVHIGHHHRHGRGTAICACRHPQS